MHTGIEIDGTLMADVLKAMRVRTKREAVERGLKALVRMYRQAGLRGALSWTEDLDAPRMDR